jgi:hypothetical protein
MIRDFVRSVNIERRNEIQWPTGNRLRSGMEEFRAFSGLPAMVGAIDGTHFYICRPTNSLEDYFYFKSGGYTMQCQAVVEKSKKFIDVSMGMPGSTNDSRQLRRSMLYHMASTSNLFNPAEMVEGFVPYLLGDKGFLLLPRLLTPYWDVPDGRRSVQKRMFNRKLSTTRSIVENAFGILKQSFQELLKVLDLHVTILSDVILCCCLLHNVFLGQSLAEVDRLLAMLQREGMASAVDDDPPEDRQPQSENAKERKADRKQAQLAIYLIKQRA